MALAAHRRFIALGLAMLAIGAGIYVIWPAAARPITAQQRLVGTHRLAEPSSSDPTAVREMAYLVSQELIANFPQGWPMPIVEDIASAVRVSIPVLAATDFQGYYTDLEDRGLVGSPTRINARYEQRVLSQRWKDLESAGRVAPLPKSAPTTEDMSRLILETNHVYFDDALADIDRNSVVVRVGSRLPLNAGERYTMSAAMSDDWTGGSAEVGFTVEFSGMLQSGRRVRVVFLFANKSQGGIENWGIASCALITTGPGEFMYAPF